jgi:4-hydroxymandelate oxidase
VRTTRREACGLLAAAALGSRSSLAQTPGPASKPAPAAADPAVLTLADYEPLAKRRMSHMAYEYVAAGGGDEITVRENHLAFDRIRLQPRILQDVSRLDLTLTLFNQPLEHPILLAPTAYHRIVHSEGELATVRGAADARAILVASSFATTSIEDMGRASAGAGLWFQLYVNRDRGFTRDLVQRAEAAGCRALCVTVDSPTTAFRYREARVRFALPESVERMNLKSLANAGNVHRTTEGSIYNAVLDPTLAWKDVEWLRGITRVPVLIKGVLNPDDASKGADAGVGIVVSNHGGRNLDTLPATIDALPRVADAVKGRVPILVDGGIRRGTDVLKALASGASAVLIGRPYLYGLAVDGPAGVTRVVQMLRRELELAMAMTGRRSLAEIDRTVLWR